MKEEVEVKHSEYERSRVPESETRGFKAFVGLFAGEHCAGTELMIGVEMNPGHTAFERMPFRPSSRAQVLAMPMTPNLAAA